MDFADAGLVGGLVAVTMGLVEAIKVLVRRRSNGNGGGNPLAGEQLAALREISHGIAALRSDLRAAALEQGHLQKTVDAVHSRMDNLAEKVADRLAAGR
jgi:hypothetical protein